MFEVNGVTYELKFNLKRIELIENAIGSSIMSIMAKSKGMFSISELKMILAFAMKEEGADSFIKQKDGMEHAEALIRENGYAPVNAAVLEKLEEDCPFFFRVD